MNVFVLGTGRCGSVTFARACEHLQRFTVAHESRAGMIGDARLAFPDEHIEIDNRLSWFLGELGERFDGRDVLYVHLRRDPEAVARSFLARWDSAFPASIIRAFSRGIVMRRDEWDDADRLDVCRWYVRSLNANIAEFARSRPSCEVDVEAAESDFAQFLDRIGASGDLDAAVGEWATRHNHS